MGQPHFQKKNNVILRSAIAGVIAASGHASLVQAADNKAEKNGIEQVVVYGEQGQTNTATKLDLTIFETPQTVTAISRVQLDDFALNTVNEVLDYTPGVTVEEIETDRTYYTARGFDIINFQYDGLGIPFTYGNNDGQLDTAIFEKIEVVKGAAGLITGLANPSATINYVRKRPTKDLQMSARLSVDEWDGYRIDGDISGSLTSAVRGRVVVAKEDTESYLNRHEDQTDIFYGVFEADLGENTLLTIGHSYNKSASDGVLWGALPLVYSDGSHTDYSVSTNNAPDWTFADNKQQQTFIELKHLLTDDWSINAVTTFNRTDGDSELFYVYGAPDPTTEVGLFGYAGAFDSEEKQDIYDVYLSGRFELGGQQHDLVVGYSQADIETKQKGYYDYVNGLPVLTGDWAKGNTPRPNLVTHDPSANAADIEQEHKAFYVSSRLSITNELSLLVGARRADIEQTGFNYGAPSDTDAEETVPYYGATYQIADDIMVYGSYSEVFTQQAWVNAQYQPLGATQGESTEFGLKKTFNDQNAVLTIAVFESKHENLGEFVGRDSNNVAIYEARAFESQGYEIEFSGELVDGLNISAGFTKVDLEDNNGDDIRPYVPGKLAKLSASYRFPALPDLKVGGLVKWQDDTTTASESFEQKAYTTVDLAISYDVTANLTTAINIENVTDKKYLNSLYWEQAYYAAPRNIEASVTWKY